MRFFYYLTSILLHLVILPHGTGAYGVNTNDLTNELVQLFEIDQPELGNRSPNCDPEDPSCSHYEKIAEACNPEEEDCLCQEENVFDECSLGDPGCLCYEEMDEVEDCDPDDHECFCEEEPINDISEPESNGEKNIPIYESKPVYESNLDSVGEQNPIESACETVTKTVTVEKPVIETATVTATITHTAETITKTIQLPAKTVTVTVEPTCSACVSPDKTPAYKVEHNPPIYKESGPVYKVYISEPIFSKTKSSDNGGEERETIIDTESIKQGDGTDNGNGNNDEPESYNQENHNPEPTGKTDDDNGYTNADDENIYTDSDNDRDKDDTTIEENNTTENNNTENDGQENAKIPESKDQGDDDKPEDDDQGNDYKRTSKDHDQPDQDENPTSSKPKPDKDSDLISDIELRKIPDDMEIDSSEDPLYYLKKSPSRPKPTKSSRETLQPTEIIDQ